MYRSKPQIWGGVECTVNRVGDLFYDQLVCTGHDVRATDIDLFANLGIRSMRYPLLWERLQPDLSAPINWQWADSRLSMLRERGIVPIIGLLHHGSGPRDSSLVNPDFAHRFAQYAREVASRYPWLEYYTPINEPLTTARFSGLYGHWFPHGRDSLTFARALLNQCRAITLAMNAIRQINPHAQLVQTDDLGKTQSTPRLNYQADFENERRWLTFDLLCGRVDERHSMSRFLRSVGVEQDELAWFVDHPCPPDIVGVNYYVTSERFLDDRVEHYPHSMRGGNGRHEYVDLEAVRVPEVSPVGLRTLLTETWMRYRLPLAITEIHLGCTREEQLRWLRQAWEAACHVRRAGIDLRAVTVWSLLGSYDWNSLLTNWAGHYEPGVFDVRSGTPRPTALASYVRALTSGPRKIHPTGKGPGWWNRPAAAASPTHSKKNKPLIIVGAKGTLGRAFAKVCDQRGLTYHLLSRKDMDIAEGASADAVLSQHKPWAVVNAAGFVRVDEAESRIAACRRENSDGPAVLAASCAKHDVRLLTFSSDLVFDGSKCQPYQEKDPVSPVSVYGQTKAEAEARVLRLLPETLVVRTSAFFGPWDPYNFVTSALRELAAGRGVNAADNYVVSPTYVPDLVHASLDLLIDGECGIWHLANQGATSWFEFARQAAGQAGLEPSRVKACPVESLGWIAPRPAYSVLGSERGALLPSLADALRRYITECQVPWATNPN